MTAIIYILAAIGAVTVTVVLFKIARQLAKDWNSKPTPWLGGSCGGGGLNGH